MNIPLIIRKKWDLADSAGRKCSFGKAGRPTMHYQQELEKDLERKAVVTDEILWRWFHDRYSTSKHLLTLYSLGIGLKARTIIEIGCGRSTFALLRVAIENQGKLICVDQRDFSYLLSDEEKKHCEFVHGKSNECWELLEKSGEKADLVFLDYFSEPKLDEAFCAAEFECCIQHVRENGIVCLHDTSEEMYKITEYFAKFARSEGVEAMTLPFNYGLGMYRKSANGYQSPVADLWEKK